MTAQVTSQSYKVRFERDAVWHMANEHEEAILDNLENDSDRAVAIIAASIVEARIDLVLRHVMQRDKKIEERMFQTSGPIGSFSSKIDLCFLFHIVSKEAHANLAQIKNIRNLFAHDLSVQDFNTRRIKDRVRDLGLVDTHIAQGKDEPGFKMLSLDRPVPIPFIWLMGYRNAKDEPRKRYLMACSIFVSAFMGIMFDDWLRGGLRPII